MSQTKTLFAKIAADIAAIEAKTAPLRAKRDALAAKAAPIEAEMKKLADEFLKIEREGGLFDLKNEQAALARALGANSMTAEQPTND